MLKAYAKRPGAASVLGILFVFCLWVLSVEAQADTTIDTLTVEIWPDYDQPDVLVLLTGELAHTTALPATVTIPLPANARVNAVARITPDRVMIDDIDYTETADSITLTTPDPSFRVEYYYPYSVAGDQHSFAFNWTPNMAINQMFVAIQQPASAANLTTNPATTDVAIRQTDGLTYHTLPAESVPAGQTFAVSVSYQMTSPLLTAAQLQNQGSGATGVSPSSTTPTATSNWALYLAAVGTTLIGIAMFWQAYNNRQKRGPTRPARSKSTAKASFCHNCGQRRQRGDQFCRHCGTALK